MEKEKMDRRKFYLAFYQNLEAAKDLEKIVASTPLDMERISELQVNTPGNFYVTIYNEAKRQGVKVRRELALEILANGVSIGKDSIRKWLTAGRQSATGEFSKKRVNKKNTPTVLDMVSTQLGIPKQDLEELGIQYYIKVWWLYERMKTLCALLSKNICFYQMDSANTYYGYQKLCKRYLKYYERNKATFPSEFYQDFEDVNYAFACYAKRTIPNGFNTCVDELQEYDLECLAEELREQIDDLIERML
jgi:hypothetical protein